MKVLTIIFRRPPDPVNVGPYHRLSDVGVEAYINGIKLRDTGHILERMDGNRDLRHMFTWAEGMFGWVVSPGVYRITVGHKDGRPYTMSEHWACGLAMMSDTVNTTRAAEFSG